MGFTDNPATLVAGIATAVAALFGVMWRVKKDTGSEERRRVANKAKLHAEEFGLDIVADLLDDYVVQDISGLIGKVGQGIRTAADKDKLFAMLDRSFYRQLEKRSQNSEQREKIVAVLGGGKASE